MKGNDPWLRNVMEQVNAQVKSEAEAVGQMSLGAFIAALETMPEEAVVSYDTGAHPGEPLSYRGYYDHLAFELNGASDTTVSHLLAWARGAMGRSFEGYKGGDFIMHQNTPVWAASYGTTAGSRRIIGVREAGDRVAILTGSEDDC